MRKISFSQSLVTRLSMISMISIGALSTATHAKPLNFELPDDQAELVKGPGFDVAVANCGACHSSEYMKSQPHGTEFGKAFWQAEVTKMINVYKAPIAPEDVQTIVEYLAESYK